MKRLVLALSLICLTAFIATSHAKDRDHVPKVEKVSNLEKVVVAEAAVIVPVLAIETEVPETPAMAVLATENRSETFLTAESTDYLPFRQRAGLKGHESKRAITITGFIPRIRDKDC